MFKWPHILLNIQISNSFGDEFIDSMMPSNRLNLCSPLHFLPSVFPNIRVFSSGKVLHIRCPKYWSFSFSISLSNGFSRLISFRIHWFDLLKSHVTCSLCVIDFTLHNLKFIRVFIISIIYYFLFVFSHHVLHVCFIYTPES